MTGVFVGIFEILKKEEIKVKKKERSKKLIDL